VRFFLEHHVHYIGSKRHFISILGVKWLKSYDIVEISRYISSVDCVVNYRLQRQSEYVEQRVPTELLMLRLQQLRKGRVHLVTFQSVVYASDVLLVVINT